MHPLFASLRNCISGKNRNSWPGCIHCSSTCSTFFKDHGPWSLVRDPWSEVHGQRSKVHNKRTIIWGPRYKVIDQKSKAQGKLTKAHHPRSFVQRKRSEVYGPGNEHYTYMVHWDTLCSCSLNSKPPDIDWFYAAVYPLPCDTQYPSLLWACFYYASCQWKSNYPFVGCFNFKGILTTTKKLARKLLPD